MATLRTGYIRLDQATARSHLPDSVGCSQDIERSANRTKDSHRFASIAQVIFYSCCANRQQSVFAIRGKHHLTNVRYNDCFEVFLQETFDDILYIDFQL